MQGYLAEKVDQSRRGYLLMSVKQEERQLALSVQWQAAIISPDSLYLRLCT